MGSITSTISPSLPINPHCRLIYRQWGKSDIIQVEASQNFVISKHISTKSEGITLFTIDEEGGDINNGKCIVYYNAGNTSNFTLMLKKLDTNSLSARVIWCCIS